MSTSSKKESLCCSLWRLQSRSLLEIYIKETQFTVYLHEISTLFQFSSHHVLHPMSQHPPQVFPVPTIQIGHVARGCTDSHLLFSGSEQDLHITFLNGEAYGTDAQHLSDIKMVTICTACSYEKYQNTCLVPKTSQLQYAIAGIYPIAKYLHMNTSTQAQKSVCVGGLENILKEPVAFNSTN